MNHGPIKPETVPCPLCRCSQFIELFEARDLLHGRPGVFGVARCVQCSHMFTTPRPAVAALGEYYPSDYKPYANIPVHKKPGLFHRLLSDAFHVYMRSHDVLDVVRSEGSRLLELGCASGTYLHAQRKYSLQLFGVEFAEQPATFAREQLGLNVFHGQLEEAHFADDFFDGVVAWMVMEHLPDPRQTLREIHRVLKPGGTFAFSIPNAGSWEFAVFRQYWYALDVPRHLSHFSRDSITRLLESERFHVRSVYYQINGDNIVASLGYVLRAKFGSNMISDWLIHFPDNSSRIVRFVIRPLLQPIAWLLSTLHQSGRVTILAEKQI